jgi:alpha-tubulin suppressor-like RCC1 family protein
VTVLGVTHATAVGSGFYASCAIVAAGAIKCWGYGAYGVFGNGEVPSFATATSVAGLRGATVLSITGLHACALVAGRAFCWGENDYGEIGSGNFASPRLTPVAVGKLGVVTELSAGSYQTCARVAPGALRCWGENIYGEIGDGTTTNRNLPVPVSG